MRDSARYAKISFEDLCQVVEEAIDLYRQDGKPLPPAISGGNFATKFRVLRDPVSGVPPSTTAFSGRHV